MLRSLSTYDIKSDLVNEDGNGTGQLIGNCNRLIENRCYWDKNIPRDFKIYPILILDDIGFSAEGFNRFVIESTEEYVNKHTCQVFQFTVLDIDTFILISELIRKNKLNIFEEIENYHKYISISDETEISFAVYLKAKFETKLPRVVFYWLNQLN